MLQLILAIAMQGAAPEPVVLNTAAEAPIEQQATEQTAAEPAAPERKKVCRTIIDNRTGIMAKQRKQCRFVDAGEGA